MKELNTRQRFVRTLIGEEVDRVPFMKIFGGDNTIKSEWLKTNPELSQGIDNILGFEGGYRGWRILPVNFGLCGLPEDKIVSETEDSVFVRRGDGSLMQYHRHGGDFGGHTVEFAINNANDWDRMKSTDWLNPYDARRYPNENQWETHVSQYKNRDFPLQLTHGGVYGFIRNLMGDEALCYAFYDDPKLVDDIINTYTDMCIKMWERLCVDVQFDLIECWEDMSSKHASMISPATFKRFLAPQYRKIKSFADAHNIPIILVDCDGNLTELSHQMNEVGVNAMYPFEVGANNDVFKTLKELPTMSAIGCLEKNAASEGKDAVCEQMEIARKLIKNGRCIPGPDHFVLGNTTYEQYKYFMLSLKEVIMTTKPGD